jgi:CDP-diacylglycerol--glycerol-3-phosphate 3-phosphatidyltransferase
MTLVSPEQNSPQLCPVFLPASLLHSTTGLRPAALFAAPVIAMQKTSFYIVNSITVYRLLASFVLLYLIVIQDMDTFRWLLPISFFTDAVDGFLARRYQVVSRFGSRLDSIADDLTVLMGILGVCFFRPGFIYAELRMVVILTALYVVQLVMALVVYGKPTSFHTYVAKAAAVLQAIFLVLFFFLSQWPVFLFYIAAIVTAMQIVEEIILIKLLPNWQADVKGIWWVLNRRSGPQLHKKQ